MAKLPFLQEIDLTRNYIYGSIPKEWAVLPLVNFSLLGNRISGQIPSWIGNFTNLRNLIRSNNFNGKIPQFIQNWTQLLRLDLQASGLQGPIPSGISRLKKLDDLSLNINCGGDQVTTDDNLIYESDNDGSDGVSTFRVGTNWAVSSTGAFLDLSDNNNFITTTRQNLSMPDSELYANARISPLSLSYYGLCLLNGNYSVKLHFAEIIITDYNGYISPGRRIFDVYIQGELVLKDFNIKVEANGSEKAVVKKFNAIVTKNKLEIRFYWAGKGTTNIPISGTYGPLVSAISVAPSDLRRLELQTGSFSLRQIQDATNNFSASNKIGEGGFGSVYRGLLSDGTMIAVKQLSSKSTQGNREFLNEIGMISALQYPNLVRLYGCCVEENQLLLVYEYLENNSLANALFGPEKYELKLDWLTRQKICVGIARGLAYLHEESMLRIVHRDIKPTNVLLDRELNPKISDFGLAKLNENEHTHISTRVAGTMGYMAPEYATRGYLTLKADVYSFGIVALEIITGKSVTKITNEGDIHLLDWVCKFNFSVSRFNSNLNQFCMVWQAHMLREKGELLMLVDKNLGLDFNKEEALRMIKVSLLCSNSLPARRPPMSMVVSMLTSDISVPDFAPYSGILGEHIAQEIMYNPHDCKCSASESPILHFHGEVIDDS
ncbi:putative leucine-rich repeat receptor-like serine/threonine-protein kinase [Dendrobium catenatum]|uniref:non-specific serine/threonine protein kinase n=1 Tax=Dendrobium catenatum TaxID=906689 RepID=A0A2I0WYC0_9ASPA|nr:putative leucine-rich repeat receptor-like serine/threonine-protein kinase [Dendrobium catenatum]